MDRGKFERRIVSVLLILLGLESALLVLHLSWGGFRPPSRASERRLAGHVVTRENELLKRANSSLVWEKSAPSDEIYYHDSVLTLAQSTATLKLFKDTEIHLSENTLVTIEPPDQASGGEIRLRVSRGGFKERNPSAAAHVAGDAWAMDIRPGSDVDFRKVGDGRFELNVKKGDVQFDSELGRQNVAADEVLRVENGSASKLSVDRGLQWRAAPAARLYTHGAAAKIPLQWSGEAAELVIQSLEGKETAEALSAAETSRDLELPPGEYKIYLRKDDRVSPALDVEVWKAPVLHLLAPLPRNRVKTGDDTDFVWMTAPEIKAYRLTIEGAKTKIFREQESNSYSTRFSDEDDVRWRVEGVDKNGFVIPAPYEYPLYIREAPLAAPKLHTPVIREPTSAKPPAGKGAGLWPRIFNAIFPQAQADELQYQAQFSWDPVEGADNYVLEISETPDFRAPVLTKTVTSNAFLWRKISRRTYYWRVAAGSKDGRLGLFSDPAEVDLSQDSSAGVVVSLLEPEPSHPAPKPKKEPTVQVHFGSEPDDEHRGPDAPTPVPQPPPPAVPVVSKMQFRDRWSVAYAPSYVSVSATGGADVRASLSGAAPGSGFVERERKSDEDHMLRLEADFSRRIFAPSPADAYPAQSKLGWSEVGLTAALHSAATHLGFGVHAMQTVQFKRQSALSIDTSYSYACGPTFESLFRAGPFDYLADYSAVIGSDYGVLTSQRARWNAGILFFGAQGDASALFHGGAHTYTIGGSAFLGFQF